MQRSVDDLPGSGDEVDLRKRIEPLLFGYVEGKRQRAALDFVEKILERGDEIEPLPQQRAAQRAPRRLILDSAHVIASNPKIGERIVEIGMPLIAASPRFDRDHA